MFKNIDLEQSIKNAQTSLVIMIVLTLINVIGMLFGSSFYLPYSAMLPAFLTNQAIINQLNTMYIFVVLVIALYSGIAVIARDKPIWYIGALLLYVIDTGLVIFLLFTRPSFNIIELMDVAFHGWILYSLTKGSVAAFRTMVE